MNPIYWLEIINPANKIKHLSNHYILKIESKFMVFTTKPVKGLNNIKISNKTIMGESDPQYLVEKVHNLQPSFVTKPIHRGYEYYLSHQTELQPFIEKMQTIVEKIS